MIDKEKVLHGLDSCGNDDGHPDRCGRTACPYRDNGVLCTHKLAHDALLLIIELLEKHDLGRIEDDAVFGQELIWK